MSLIPIPCAGKRWCTMLGATIYIYLRAGRGVDDILAVSCQELRIPY